MYDPRRRQYGAEAGAYRLYRKASTPGPVIPTYHQPEYGSSWDDKMSNTFSPYPGPSDMMTEVNWRLPSYATPNPDFKPRSARSKSRSPGHSVRFSTDHATVGSEEKTQRERRSPRVHHYEAETLLRGGQTIEARTGDVIYIHNNKKSYSRASSRDVSKNDRRSHSTSRSHDSSKSGDKSHSRGRSYDLFKSDDLAQSHVHSYDLSKYDGHSHSRGRSDNHSKLDRENYSKSRGRSQEPPKYDSQQYSFPKPLVPTTPRLPFGHGSQSYPYEASAQKGHRNTKSWSVKQLFTPNAKTSSFLGGLSQPYKHERSQSHGVTRGFPGISLGAFAK